MSRRRQTLLGNYPAASEDGHSPYETLSDLALGSLGLLLTLVITSLVMASPGRAEILKSRLEGRIDAQKQRIDQLAASLNKENERDLKAEANRATSVLRQQQAEIAKAQAELDGEQARLQSLQVQLSEILRLADAAEEANSTVAKYEVEMRRLNDKLRYFTSHQTGTSVDRTGRPYMKYGAVSYAGEKYFTIGETRFEDRTFRAILDNIENAYDQFFIQWDSQSNYRTWQEREWAKETLDGWGWRPTAVEKKEGY